MMAARTAIVVAGGDTATPVPRPLPSADLVIAADSGLDRAAALGLTVDIAVGDFDSASPQALETARQRGVPIHQHPTAKEATDLELALDEAMLHDVDRIVVVGSAGGRLDHLISTSLLLAREDYSSVDIAAHFGAATLHVLRRAVTLHGTPGSLVSLIPLQGKASGVSTSGLRFPLYAEDLFPGSTRGVSNEFVAPEASVTVAAGVLLVVQPQPEDT